ncbi:unnamed protein product [Meloidogyne enterolobii]|uniref:Uncharacterized protein n=1 Tax=Meloidogyne enterolobii TaxID=390850 RepID=A0ACB1B0P1_MELEN
MMVTQKYLYTFYFSIIACRLVEHDSMVILSLLFSPKYFFYPFFHAYFVQPDQLFFSNSSPNVHLSPTTFIHIYFFSLFFLFIN